MSEIDWEEVKDLAMAGCGTTAICAHQGIALTTIYMRCERDHGMTYPDFIAQFKERGANLIRAQQFAKAMGYTDKGDNTLLIWLGKQRCGQRDNPLDLHQIDGKLSQALDKLDEIKAKSD